MMSHVRFFAFAFAWLLATTCVEGLAADVRGAVYAIDVEHTGGDRSGGSAILLFTEEVDKDHFGWFATCFHVIHRAEQFAIKRVDGQKEIAIADSESAKVYIRREADVAILRVQLADTGKSAVSLYKGRPMKLKDDSYFKWSRELVSIDGTAFGYSFLDRKSNVPVAVKIWGHETFSGLPLVDGQPIVTKWEKVFERVPRRVAAVTFLGNEITMPGMSGGLVVTNEESPQFAGMVFARVAGVQGIAVSAETVIDTLNEAIASESLGRFEPAVVSGELPFNAELQATKWRGYEESRVEWESFDQWSLAFRNDHEQIAMFERFQEVGLNLNAMNLDETDVILEEPEADEFDGYDFVLNGDVVQAGEALNLHVGENVLVIK